MRRILISVYLLIFFFTGVVWAGDIVSTWKYEGGTTMKLSVRDEQHIRMDTAQDSYMLKTGGKTYMVQKSGEGWKATDMAEMAKMMSGFAGKKTSPNIDDYTTKYKYAGRKEKVAGYKGKVYNVEVRDGSGKLVSSDELVFSKSKDIRRINKAMMQISSQVGSMLVAGSSKSLEAAQKDADKYGSVLRYGKSMTLTSVKKPSLKLSYYQLPKGTKKQKLNIPGNIPKTDTDSGNEKKAVGKGGFLGDLLKGSSGADKDETKSNSSDEVKKGVNKILNSFFK
jgi:hypothetical protein